MSPFRIFRGYEPKFHDRIYEQAAKRFPTSKLSFEELEEERNINENIIRQGLIISKDKMVKRHNDEIREIPSFKIGSLVKLKSFASKRDDMYVRKTKVRYKCPFIIYKILQGEGAILSTMSGQILPDIYPLRHLVLLKEGLTDNLPFSETITAVEDNQPISCTLELEDKIYKRNYSRNIPRILVQPKLQTESLSRKFRFWLPCQTI